MACLKGQSHGPIAALVATFLIWSATASATAGGICVQCEEPAQTYECVLPDGVTVGGNALARRGATLACIQLLAREKGHARCGVRRGVQGPCIGDRVALGEDIFPPTSPTPPTETNVAPPESAGGLVGNDHGTPEPEVKTEGTPNDAPPKTVVDMARRAAEDTNRTLERTTESLEDAGNAVGSALERSWTCLVTLFTDCR